MSSNRTTADPPSGRVRVLPEHVARKIAAGEVIDRPHAAVRELLDNAVDSCATEVTLEIRGGGIDEVRVSDNGCGMDEADLDMCWLPHATSKIASAEDLERVSTLGFRGEALASLAACSRLEILSSRDAESRRLVIHGGKKLELAPHGGAPGTTVSVKDLFFNMPARRRFLKSPRAESGLCRRVFLEKAAAHPHLAFRLVVDGVLKTFLPPGTHRDRIAAAWPRLGSRDAWWESSGRGDGFRITVVHARPELSRRDRKSLQVYANRRRIDEFALVQAMQYAYDAWMPGGAFPAAFAFVEIDPALVDFNIHPAKKEARFRDLPAIRHRLIELIKDRITSEAYRRRAAAAEDSASRDSAQGRLMDDDGAAARRPASIGGGPWHRSRTEAPSARESAAEFGEAARRLRHERRIPVPPRGDGGVRYLGQAMGVFLVAEAAGSLYIVDQHAAHERILFERFRNADPASERLLVPRPLDLDRSAAMKLELRQERLAALGLVVEADDAGGWVLAALPREAVHLEDDVVEFLESGAGDAEGLEKALWADLSCKAAVKDNHVLDDAAARTLLEDAFALELPRCPHGRPIWFEVSREELFELVGRTV